METLPPTCCGTCHLVASCCHQMVRVGGDAQIDTVTFHLHTDGSCPRVTCQVLAAFHPSTPTPESPHPAGDDSSLEHLQVPHLEESAAVANDLAPLRANQAAPPAAPHVRTAACYCCLCCCPLTVTCPAYARGT